MVRRIYGYAIFEHHKGKKGYENGPKQIGGRNLFSIQARSTEELDRLLDEKVEEINKGLKTGQYTDDWVWKDTKAYDEEE